MTAFFPILRAPQVVISHIMNVADPHELVTIALCSKRAFNLVKTYRKKSKFLKLRMNVPSYETIIIFHDKEYIIFKSRYRLQQYWNDPHQKSEKVKIGGYNAKIAMTKTDEGYWNVMWKIDQLGGYKLLMEWTSDLFQIDINILSMNEFHLRLIDWVQSRQKKVEVADFEFKYKASEKRYRYVLDNCRAKRINITLEIPESFQYDGVLGQGNSIFFAKGGFWVNLRNLFTMDLEELWIDDSKLINHDINKFLMHWLAGGSHRLKFLWLEMQSLNVAEVLRGIESFVKEGSEETQDYVRSGGVKNPIPTEFFIQRDDGVIATVGGKNIFIMAVWPDSENNNFLENSF